MRHVNLAVVLSIMLLGGEVFGQNNVSEWIIQHGLSTDYPVLYKVALACNVRFQQVEGMYYYDYTLASNRSNKGNINDFEIDISHHPSSVIYDTLGLKFATSFDEGRFRRYYPLAANAVESVGFPSLPNLNWIAGIVHSSVAEFDVDTLLPTPGSTVSGFTIMSKALPGIRAFTAYPDFNVNKYLPDIDGDTAAALDSIYIAVNNYIDSMTANMNYQGWTVGPTAPPLDFSASAWIDTLASYKHQCVALGWLTNGPAHEKDESDDRADEGIVERLDRRLGKAKIALAKNDSVKARLELELFVKEVELLDGLGKKSEMRNKKSVLTSEGYALLKYNAEYLIEKLPERHGRGDEGEHRGKK